MKPCEITAKSCETTVKLAAKSLRNLRRHRETTREACEILRETPFKAPGTCPCPVPPLRSPPSSCSHGAGESFHPDFQDLILLSWPFVVTTTQLSMYIDVPNCEQHSSVAVLVCLVLGSMISTKNFDHVAIALTMHDVLGYLLRP